MQELVVCLIFGFIAIPATYSAPNAKKPKKTAYYTYECRVVDSDSRLVRAFPGIRCIFLENGDLVSASQTQLTYYDRFMKARWQRDLPIHHWLELTHDKKFLLTLGSSVHAHVGGDGSKMRIRYDVLYKLDLKSGKTIGSWDLFTHYQQFKKMVDLVDSSAESYAWPLEVPDVHPELKEHPTHEVSHFNSISDVPKNTKNFFKAGQIVLNACCSGRVLVFNKDLSHALYSIRQSPGITHSATVTKEGTLLYYQNNLSQVRGIDPAHDRSMVVEYDPVKKAAVWTFLGIKDQDPHWGTTGGYIEKIGDDRFMFATLKEAYEIDGAGNIYWQLRDPQAHDLMPVKKLDLSSFLHNNQS